MKQVNGNELLYHFVQKCWLEDDPEAAQGFIKKAIDTLGIWMHPKYYQELPIFVPYAVRDSACRHSGPNRADEWGAPDENGYFRDDNSLIKGIVASMRIHSPISWIRGLKGVGFTASHVWREPADYWTTNLLASRRPELNSFVPNLVWLPKQIAKFTDREGSFAQRYLQMLSRHIYYSVPVKAGARDLMDKIWSLLPPPSSGGQLELPDIKNIPFFEYKDGIVVNRKTKIITGVRNACREVIAGDSISAMKVVSERYKNGLASVRVANLIKLADWLDDYLQKLQ